MTPAFITNDRAIRQSLRRQIAKAQEYLERRPDAPTVSDYINELEAELREMEE